jgi:hypothetical protein
MAFQMAKSVGRATGFVLPHATGGAIESLHGARSARIMAQQRSASSLDRTHKSDNQTHPPERFAGVANTLQLCERINSFNTCPPGANRSISGRRLSSRCHSGIGSGLTGNDTARRPRNAFELLDGVPAAAVIRVLLECGNSFGVVALQVGMSLQKRPIVALKPRRGEN